MGSTEATRSGVSSSHKLTTTSLCSNNNNANISHETSASFSRTRDSSLQSDNAQLCTSDIISCSPKFNTRGLSSTLSQEKTSDPNERTATAPRPASSEGRLVASAKPLDTGQGSGRGRLSNRPTSASATVSSEKAEQSVRRQSALIRSTIEKLSADASKFDLPDVKKTNVCEPKPPKSSVTTQKLSPTENVKRLGSAVKRNHSPAREPKSNAKSRSNSPGRSVAKSQAQSPVAAETEQNLRMSIASVSDLRKNFEGSSAASSSKKSETSKRTGAILKVNTDTKSAPVSKEAKTSSNISVKLVNKNNSNTKNVEPKTLTSQLKTARQSGAASVAANKASAGKTPVNTVSSSSGSPKLDARGPAAKSWQSRPSTPENKSSLHQSANSAGGVARTALSSLGKSFDSSKTAGKKGKSSFLHNYTKEDSKSGNVFSADKPASQKHVETRDKHSWLHAKQTSSESLKSGTSVNAKAVSASTFLSSRQKSSDCITVRRSNLTSKTTTEMTKPREKSFDSPPTPPSVPPRHVSQKSSTLAAGPSAAAVQRKLAQKSCTLSTTAPSAGARGSDKQALLELHAPPLPPKTGKKETSLLETIEGSLGITLDSDTGLDAGQQIGAADDWPEDNPRSLEFLTSRSKEAEDILDGGVDRDGEKDKSLKMKKTNSCSGMMGWKSIFSIWGKSGEKPDECDQETAELAREAEKCGKVAPMQRPPVPLPPDPVQDPADHFYCYIDDDERLLDSGRACCRKSSDSSSSPPVSGDQFYSSIDDHDKADSCKSDSGIDVSTVSVPTEKPKEASNFTIRNLFCMAPATTYATTIGQVPPPLPPARSKKVTSDDVIHDVFDKSKSLPITRVSKTAIEVRRDLAPGSAR